VCNAQPLSTLVSPLHLGAAHPPSPEFHGISPAYSSPLSADAGPTPSVTGVPNPTTFLDHSNGLREAPSTSRPDERGVPDILQKPTPPILAPRPPNKFELRVFPDKDSITNDAL
jgi:hypothetical protein